jgi:stage II sporulation protein M
MPGVPRPGRPPVPEPEGTSSGTGGGPASQPIRPDRPSPFADLDHAGVGMLLPPPRPDFLPSNVAATVGRYLRRPVRRAMLLLFGLLVVGVLIGLVTTLGMDRPQAVSDARLFGANAPASFTVAGIFLHNAELAIVPLILFPLLFWGPAASSAVTGFTVGRLAGTWQHLHLPNGELIVALVPHGVFEIPAFLLAGVVDWRIGLASWESGRFGGSWWTRVRAAFRAAAPAILIVVITLAVAATIEVKVTPTVVRDLYPR